MSDQTDPKQTPQPPLDRPATTDEMILLFLQELNDRLGRLEDQQTRIEETVEEIAAVFDEAEEDGEDGPDGHGDGL